MFLCSLPVSLPLPATFILPLNSPSAQAAILRIGMYEMRKFAALFYADTIDEVFWDSAGLADLLTTCYGGRNRRCAEEFVRTGKSWAEIERTLLKGQKVSENRRKTRDF